MSQLDHERTLARLDPLNLNQAAERLPEQLRLGWEEAGLITLPKAYGSPEHLVLCGMGGSLLGARLAAAVLHTELTVPVTLVNGYDLPPSVKKDSLVIIISVSGTTEEMLAVYKEALKRKLKVVIVATGGPLLDLALKHHQPHFTFNFQDYAPQGYATGFLLGGLLRIFTKIGLTKFKVSQLEAGLAALHEVIDTCAPDILTAENPAKQIASELAGQQALILGAEHLIPSAHALAYHLNRTAKHQASALALPEFTHHALESFIYPEGSASNTTVIFLKSNLYHPRVQLQFTHTADLLEDMGASLVEYDCGGGGPLAEITEVLALSYYVSWYTGVLNGCETGDMPYITALRQALKQKSSR